jgi:hypothetical protein
MNYTRITALLLTLLMVSFSRAHAQDLDETDFGSTAASVFKVNENNHYANNLALRAVRKIGLGLGVGGTLGLYGLNMEVNFEDENAGFAGLGAGDGYNSFNIGWKHTFEGDTVAPYATAGYSRWYNSGSGGNFKNSAVLDRVLNDQQKAGASFAADFLTGAVGIQYTQLNGVMAGTSLYAEFVLLGEVNSATLVPTGGVGAGYYF